MIIKDIEQFDINSHLSRIRSANEREHQERTMDVYQKIPEIEAIDKEISSISIAEARNRILKKGSDASISEKIEALSQKKKNLLLENGYDADYLQPIYNCSICKDWGEIDGTVCNCVKKMRISELYKRSNLSDVFERENFGTFSLECYSKEVFKNHSKTPYENATKILSNAKNFVENFDREHGNILIYGGTGLGKTFISNCIAKELLDKGKTVLYLSSNELFEQVLSGFIMSREKSPALEAIYEYIYKSELLIIDDLGTEVLSSFVKSQLFEIINQRMLSSRSTIITTNLNLETLQDRYTERVMSRIADGFVLYPLYGDDIRYQKHQ